VLTQVNDDAPLPTSPDVVTFASSVTGTINLDSPGGMGQNVVRGSVDIEGPGARRLTLDMADLTFRAFYFGNVDGVQAKDSISGLSLDDAVNQVIYDSAAALTLDDDTFENDSRGTVESANGPGSVTVNGCTFADDAGGEGGALTVFTGGSAKIKDSTFVGDSAGSSGGALFFEDASATVIGSTFSGDSAGDPNQGADAAIFDGTLVFEDSVLGGTSAPVYVAGGDGGHMSAVFSLIQDATGITAELNSTDITGKSPDLGPLANNGGETNTELPRVGSPVINAGKAFGLAVDQRGLQRSWKFPGVRDARGGDGTDIGAAELEPYITSLKLSKGKAGAKETIHGSGFDHTTAVYFGKVEAKTFKVVNDNEITVTVPKGKGKVAITLKSAGGLTKSVSGGQFYYVAPPPHRRRRRA
jgi:hypothetical protein